MKRATSAIVLAAGEGTRMRSSTPKVLHTVGGLAMVGHVLRAVSGAGCNEVAAVVGNGAGTVTQTLRDLESDIGVYVQKERLGTAHAVLAARPVLETGNDILIAYGDTPLVTEALFADILGALSGGADIAVLGFHTTHPTGYGRMIVKDGALVAIREEKDATDEERAIRFCNSGIMGLRGDHALSLLEAISNDNAKGEYYLTDAVGIGVGRGLNVVAVEGREEDTLGVNNRVELSEAEAIYQRRLREKMMLQGVTFRDPASVYLSYDTSIGSDTVVEANVYFAPGVQVAGNVLIKANCYLEGDFAKNQRVEVEEGAVIGPFARLRPGTYVGESAKIGNFCEVKAANVGRGAKINHLSYVGDAKIGADANIGAGTITCNYDGFRKYQTEIGEGAFVGSNSALVAPVKIGTGAYIGSGSVVVDDVSNDALAIARGRQVEKPQWAATFRAKAAK